MRIGVAGICVALNDGRFYNANSPESVFFSSSRSDVYTETLRTREKQNLMTWLHSLILGGFIMEITDFTVSDIIQIVKKIKVLPAEKWFSKCIALKNIKEIKKFGTIKDKHKKAKECKM